MPAEDLAGYVATTPLSGFWPGLSALGTKIENIFSPSGAEQVGAQTPGVFANAGELALQAALGPAATIAAPAAEATTAAGKQAAAGIKDTFSKAEDAVLGVGRNVGETLGAGVDKISTGIEWALIAVIIFGALWIFAQIRVLFPTKG